MVALDPRNSHVVYAARLAWGIFRSAPLDHAGRLSAVFVVRSGLCRRRRLLSPRPSP